ncbi:MAG: hypothetical protein AAF492_04270, partial [Verrucomicrobiota bacterium]
MAFTRSNVAGVLFVFFAGLLARPDMTHGQIIQTYYVPIAEDSIQTLLGQVNGGGLSGNNVTILGISSFASNNIITYDHWEDGYEADLNAPVQASTEIWGNGSAADGCPPNVVCIDANDVIGRGDAIFSQVTIPTPRNPANVFIDGQDKFGSTRPVAVSRVGWDTGDGTLFAGAVEVFELDNLGTNYIFPVGQNVGTVVDAFEYSGISVMATSNGTTVAVDADGDTVFETTVVLNEGQVLDVNNVNAGGGVTSDAPVQVHMVTGDVGSNFEMRWLTLQPLSQWNSSYVNPVASTVPDDIVAVFIHNPTPNPITVEATFVVLGMSQTVPINIPGNSTVEYPITDENTAQRFVSTGNEPFWAIATVDMNFAGTTHDWGYSLIADELLSSTFFVGYAPGRDPTGAAGPENDSPIWVTPLADTTIFVDYNGDGGSLSNLCAEYDESFTLNEFQSIQLLDPDGDQTAMRVFTCDGTKISAAWGQDPSTGPPGFPSIDVGTSVVPLPTIDADKTAAFAPGGDLNSDGVINPGEFMRYEITVTNNTPTDSGDVTVEDFLPPGLTYVSNSTFSAAGSVTTAVPDAGLSPFPLDEGGISIGVLTSGTSRLFFFDVRIDEPYTNVTTILSNAVTVVDDVSVIKVADVSEFTVVIPILGITKSSDAGGVVTNGQVVTYSINITNTNAFVTSTGIAVSDALPPGATLVPSSVVITAPGGSVFNFRDEFNTVAFNNQDGNTNWLTDWVDSDSAGAGPVLGGVAVDGLSALFGANSLRFDDQGAGLFAADRSVDLSAASAAILSFNWDGTDPQNENGDIVQLQIATNGGVFTVVDTFPGTFSGVEQYDISRFISSNTTIRFAITAGLTGGGENWYVDDVDIRFFGPRVTNTFMGNPPPGLLFDQDLLPGESIDITFQVVVTDLLAQVVNTACVESENEPEVLCDTVVDVFTNVFPGLMIDKTGSVNGLWFPGATNTYTIEVVNTGDTVLFAVDIEDVLPPGVSYVPG